MRGTANPTVMDNAFWDWCIRSGDSAYAINEDFGGPDSMSAGPCWCFQRMGQAQVVLPDGRQVYIAGEHEDHYDPDFYIYNDVVIVDESDNITIYGYPESVFPPTDFHSATLVGEEVYVVGNLGYPDDRNSENTQVFRLNTKSWQMDRVHTFGHRPGWIHGHTATFSDHDNAILVSGGKICGERILENLEDYQLSLDDLSWSKLTDRNWQRWILERADGESNNLWQIRSARWNKQLGGAIDEHLEQALSDLPVDMAAELALPKVSDDQLAILATLYQSPISGDLAIEHEEQYGVFLLDIDGTTVRFNEDMYDITVTIEGEMPVETANAILSDLRQKLSKLENTTYELISLD